MNGQIYLFIFHSSRQSNKLSISWIYAGLGGEALPVILHSAWRLRHVPSYLLLQQFRSSSTWPSQVSRETQSRQGVCTEVLSVMLEHFQRREGVTSLSAGATSAAPLSVEEQLNCTELHRDPLITLNSSLCRSVRTARLQNDQIFLLLNFLLKASDCKKADWSQRLSSRFSSAVVTEMPIPILIIPSKDGEHNEKKKSGSGECWGTLSCSSSWAWDQTPLSHLPRGLLLVANWKQTTRSRQPPVSSVQHSIWEKKNLLPPSQWVNICYPFLILHPQSTVQRESDVVWNDEH